ncbi:MAG TPA: creatininase family protein [Thermomicrobiales bacterium]|nr:creatininase family protein [Thermomicrobiales bacterium]
MEQPWVDFDAIRETTDLVIIPTGAVEVYGTHLPVGTDTIVVTHIARQVGERLGAPVLPALPVGFSRSLGDFPGTLSISTPTLMAYLRETAESVAGWGFKRFLFINSHRGNIGPVGEVAMALQDEHGARCAQVFWWDYVAALVKDVVETGPHANGHASEIGTSIMLHIAPELVVRDRMRDETPTNAVPYADIIQYKGMKARSDTGVVGNPAVATAEKGAEIVRRGVDRIIAFVREEFGG